MKIKLGNRYVGVGESPYIVAEIGNNHNGDLALAKRMMEVAHEAGVDAVKFQKKDVESAFPKALLESEYCGHNSFGKTYREHKMFLEFNEEQMAELYRYAEQIGITCFSTPFDIPSLECLERLGNPYYKISSFHVTNHQLIEAVCRTKKPVIISTGMSTLEEVDAAVEVLRKHDTPFVLLHCVSSYPTNDEDVNLLEIKYLQERYKCLVGYSGHERGVVICMASIPLGACLIERHFTLDRTMKGPDHAASVEPSGMKLIVRRAQYIYKALGVGEKRILECEVANRLKNRGR